jgi:phosphate transport system substrate-binding protein
MSYIFKNRFTLYLLIIVVSSLFIVSCARRNQQTTSGNKKSITIKGSDTMVQLMSSWAENFKKKNAEADMSVTGGGSGTGIAALQNGTTDICASSRDLNEKERKGFQDKGVKISETIVANDGLAVFVHSSNPVNELTMEQVKKIYTGVYKNWKEVRGPDLPIVPLSRENSSGTYVFFQEHVLDKQDFAKSVRLMTSTSAIVQSVNGESGSVGYGGIAYAHAGGVKVIKIKKDENSPAVDPSESTVLDKSYPVARPLYLFTNGEPQGNMKAFIDYCLSPDGQKIVGDIGYIKVK